MSTAVVTGWPSFPESEHESTGNPFVLTIALMAASPTD